ncbi:MAG: hypothetical protein RRX93_03545 [Bacteroidales bacterium]
MRIKSSYLRKLTILYQKQRTQAQAQQRENFEIFQNGKLLDIPSQRVLNPKRNNTSISSLLCLILFFLFTPLNAQDFTDIQKKKPFSLHGNVGGQCMGSISNQSLLATPFTYLLNLSIHPTIYGISLPLSITYGNNGFSYSQPFNTLSFTPSYKWVKAYLGRTSMSMSPYGLSNHSFDGAGVELSPNHFPLRFSAMYGRLTKAKQGDTNSTASKLSSSLSSFKRMGYAFKIGFDYKKQKLNLHFFKAKDQNNSLAPEYKRKLFPKENVVLALDGSFTIIDKLILSVQGAVSEIAEDTRAEKQKWKNPLSVLTGLFMPHRTSSCLNTAYKIGLSYSGISLSYERVSPYYQSLGAYYFSNDFENLVAGYIHSFKKVDVLLNIGWQRDDVQKIKQSRMNRFVGSANINYRINNTWNTSISYSNFLTHTKLKPIQLDLPDDPLVEDPDTIAYRQIAQQAQWNLHHSSKEYKKFQQDFDLGVSYQASKESHQSHYSNYLYASAQHSIILGPDYRLTSCINFSTQFGNEATENNSKIFHIGPSIGLNKNFLDKTLQCSLSTQYYLGLNRHKVESGLWGLRIRCGYLLAKQHQFDLQLNTRIQNKWTGKHNKNAEFSCTFSYNYRFQLSNQKTEKQKNKKP